MFIWKEIYSKYFHFQQHVNVVAQKQWNRQSKVIRFDWKDRRYNLYPDCIDWFRNINRIISNFQFNHPSIGLCRDMGGLILDGKTE